DFLVNSSALGQELEVLITFLQKVQWVKKGEGMSMQASAQVRANVASEAVKSGREQYWDSTYRTVASWVGATWIRVVSYFKGEDYAAQGICKDIFARTMEADTLSRIPTPLLKKVQQQVQVTDRNALFYQLHLFNKALYFANKGNDLPKAN